MNKTTIILLSLFGCLFINSLIYAAEAEPGAKRQRIQQNSQSCYLLCLIREQCGHITTERLKNHSQCPVLYEKKVTFALKLKPSQNGINFICPFGCLFVFGKNEIARHFNTEHSSEKDQATLGNMIETYEAAKVLLLLSGQVS